MPIKYRLGELFGEMGKLSIYALAKMIPKKHNLWVFGAWKGEKYSDNSKYLFEYVSKHRSGITTLWVTNNKLAHELVKKGGGNVAYFGSHHATWACMRADVVITCVDSSHDLPNYAISSNTKRVQLWHGLGPKAYHLDSMKERDVEAVKRMDLFSKVINKMVLIYAYLLSGQWYNGIKWLPYYLTPSQDLVVTTSTLGVKKMNQVFGQLAKTIEMLGYPRHDQLLNKNRKQSPKRKKIKVLYAPTHRSESQSRVIKQAESLKLALRRHPEIDLVVKLHDLVNNEEAADFRLVSERETEQDIYTILPTIDVLITDYSSIYTDYLLLNRPIIFVPFDQADYRDQDQGFFMDYDSVTPGPKAKDWEEAIELAVTHREWSKKYEGERKQTLELFHEVRDGKSNERITERLLKLSDEVPDTTPD